MNIAWFREHAPDRADPLDDAAALIDALRAVHTIDIVVEADAHDFVWRHALRPWDLCVYELDNTRGHQFVWAYLLNYPGVAFLKNRTLHDSRAAALDRENRLDDYRAELRFSDAAGPPMAWKGQHHTARGSWPMLRIPMLASRSVVAPHASVARSLQDAYPESRVRYAPTSTPDRQPSARQTKGCRIGTLGGNRPDVIARAFERARDAGAALELTDDDSSDHMLAASDVIVALTWPALDAPLTAALAGMAAGKAIVTFDLESTADWPALDPQTWRPRGIGPQDAPIAVTIDPRDEEHSLMLAMRRLASDAPLRVRLGQAARAWWETHATPALAAAAWNLILEEAAALAPPPRPSGWPAHLSADGTQLADGILREFGLASRLR